MNRLLSLLLLLLNFSFLVEAQQVEVIPQTGHFYGIADMAITPDGNQLLTCSRDQSLLWDLKTGFHYTPLQVGGLSFVTISSDGQYLAGFKRIGREDAQLVVAKLPEGKVIWQESFKYWNKDRYGLTFSSDGRHLLSVTSDQYQFWELSSGKKIVANTIEKGLSNFLNIVQPAISPDNRQFAIRIKDKVGVYQIQSGKTRRIIPESDKGEGFSGIHVLHFLDAETLSILDQNGKHTCNTQTGTRTTALFDESYQYLFFEKNWFLGTNNFTDSFYITDTKTLETKLAVSFSQTKFFPQKLLKINPTNHFFAVYSNNHQIHLYSLQTGELLRKFQIFRPERIMDLFFSHNGELLFSTDDPNADNTDPFWRFSLQSFGEARIIFGGEDGTYRDKTIGHWKKAVGHKGQWLYLLYGGSSPGHLYVKDLNQPDLQDRVLTTVRGHAYDFLKISPDGNWLDLDGKGFFDLRTEKLFPRKYGAKYAFVFSQEENETPPKINKDSKLASIKDNNEHYCICGRGPVSRPFSLRNINLEEVSNGLMQINCSHSNGNDRYSQMHYFPKGKRLFLLREDQSTKRTYTLIWDLQNGQLLTKIDHPSLENSMLVDTQPPRLISSNAEKAYFWDPFSGTLLDSITTHSRESGPLAMSRDHRLLALSSNTGSIEFWDWRQRKKIATFVTSSEKDYLVFTPDGYYATNKNSGQVCFQKDKALYPLEVFDVQCNRPDIVLERLGFASAESLQYQRRIVQKRWQKMGLSLTSTANAHASLPTIKVTGNIGLETSQKSIDLNIQARDANTPLAYLQILVNEVPIFGKQGYRLDQTKRHEFQGNFTVELSDGKNTIQVYTINKNGVKSPWKTIETQYIGPKLGADLHLIAVGVSRYQNASMNLNFARKDAEDVVKLFRSRPGAFQNIHTYELYDENATRQNFLKLRTQLLKTKAQDRIIVFIAGHGLRDQNLDYYLATHDTDFNRPALKGIAFDQIEALLDGIPARQKVIFMDACHSGEIDKESVQLAKTKLSQNNVIFRSFEGAAVQNKSNQLSSFDLMKDLFVDLRRNSGAVVISAASGLEFAMESDQYKNGLFTYCFLRGLTDLKHTSREHSNVHLLADANADHKVTVSELRQYLFLKVPELTQGLQRPTTRVDYLYNDFVLWEYTPGQSTFVGGSQFDFTTPKELDNLLNSGMSLNERDSEGATLLMYTLHALNDIQVVRKLVNMGADPKAKGTIHFDNNNSSSYYGNLLAIAAAKGNMEAAKYLIEDCKIPVDDKEFDKKSNRDVGWTALQWAANNGHTDLVAYLLQKGAAIDIVGKKATDTPLMLASSKGYFSTVRYLLAQGANPRIRSNEGWTALHFAARKGRIAIIDLLVQNGLSINEQTNSGWTPAMLAALNKHYTCFAGIKKWIPKLELKNKEGKSLLELANEAQLWAVYDVLYYSGSEKELFYKIKEKDQAAVLDLLEKGADINAKDAYGASMFAHIVWEFKDLDLIKSLRKYNPELNMQGVIWETEPGKGYFGNLQCLAVGTGQLEILQYFLEELQLPVDEKEYAPIDKSNTGWTPLQWACSQIQQEMVNYLLNAGANPNVGQDTHDTPLVLLLSTKNRSTVYFNTDYGYAESYSGADQIRLLLESTSFINVATSDGWTPLHLLFELKVKNFAQSTINDYLIIAIKAGADVNKPNPHGKTPLTMAAQSLDFDVCQHLLEAGADCRPLSPEKKALSSFVDNGYSVRKELTKLIKKYCGR